eukprot:10716689-Alexandrium_andersonii.AAC.1
MPRMTFAALRAACASLSLVVQEALRTAQLELCVYVPEQVESFRRAQLALLQTVAVQPRQQPSWSAADLQLPEALLLPVPPIRTKPEPWKGIDFYRLPGAKGNNHSAFSLEPPEVAARLAAPGRVPTFEPAAHGTPKIWNEQQK